MRRIPAWSQLRFGLVSSGLIVAGAIGIFYIDRLGEWARYRYRIVAYAESARDLTRGSPVWLAGVPVGRVWSVSFRGIETPIDRRIAIEMRLRRAAQPFVTQGSEVRVITSGYLGEVVVNITPPAAITEALPDGSSLVAASPVDIPEITARLREVQALVPEARQRFTALRDRARHLRPWVAGADGSAIWARIRDAERVWAALRDRDGSLARLLADRRLTADLGRVGSRLARLVATFQAPEGTTGRLVTDTILAPTVQSAGERAGRLAERLREGGGTAGRLVHDRELRIQLERTRRALTRLLERDRKGPLDPNR